MHTHLFCALLILHSCQTRSTTWLASLRGILPPWWLVLSTLNASDDDGILTHFCADWESTEGEKDQGWQSERGEKGERACRHSSPNADSAPCYLCAPPRGMWEGWGSPKTWQALAGKQALGDHPSRRQCSERTPQGPRRGYLTGVQAPGRLGRPYAPHLHKHKQMGCLTTIAKTITNLIMRQINSNKNWPTRTSTEARESSSQFISSGLSSEGPSLLLRLMG